MKSLSKIIGTRKNVEIQDWNPVVLDSSEADKNRFNMEEVLAVFQRLDADKPHGSLSTGPAPIPVSMSADITAWTPEELSWIPPFKLNNWETWKEFDECETQASAAMAIEPMQTAEEEALEILTNARARAEEIILEAQKTAEQAIQQAQAEIQQAAADGYQQGWQQAQDEAAYILKAADKIVLDVHAWQDALFAQSEDMVVQIIRDIAKTMFGDGIDLDETALQINLNRVLENAKSLGNLRIFLNPSDANRLDTAWKEYQSMLTGNRVMIIASEKIRPGGCFVQGEMGSIDARVETQFDAVLSVFSQKEESIQSV